MIYSINEGFFGKKPNKYAMENPKEVEKVVKGYLRYLAESIKNVNNIYAAVSKTDFSDTDGAKVTAYMATWSQLDEKLGKDFDRKARMAMIKLTKFCNDHTFDELNIAEGVSSDFKSLCKKLCKGGEYANIMKQYQRTLFKAAGRYDELRAKYQDMNKTHKTACENYGGYVGALIGGMPGFNPFKKVEE